MKRKIVIVLTLVCFGSLLGQALMFLQFNYTHTWKCCADYEHYAQQFTLVKDYVLEEFLDGGDRRLSVRYTENKEYDIYNPENNEYVDCSNEVKEALQIICKQGFPNKDALFNEIRIQKGRVSFGIENGQYALVYSPDDKPTWVNIPDDADVLIKEIGDGWYHVVENPN